MDAHKRMIVSDILAKENWQFIVPIYQRAYKWTGEECTRLVNDIIACGKGTKEHFVGSIVYQLDKNLDLADLKLYLVDGQQRLTTFVLITKALNLLAKDFDDDDSKYVASKTDKILYIDVDDKARGYKVKPSKNDAGIFNAIISAKSYKEITENPVVLKNSLLYNNFITAYERLKNEISKGTSIKDVIYNGGLLKISVVEIQLTFDENAQEIFESINSLGVELSNADLIRNYLLMSNSNQQVLYDNYWEPIQDKLIGENNMEVFVRHYLHMKREYSINDKDLYKEYIKLSETFMDDGVVNRDAMLKDLYEVAQIYEPFIKKSGSYSLATNLLMQELRDMAQSTAYPFLMRVFLDRKQKPDIVTEDILNKTINLIIVYLVRRTICAVPTNTLRSFMLTLYRRIFKVEANYNRYYEAIYAFLTSVRSNDYLRSQEDVKKNLVTAPLYRNTKFVTYLLYRLENGRYPNSYSEMVVADNTTVEHIMPQTMTDEWEQMIATEEHSAEEIHKTYVDTLGNLSLSSREKNSVMSNESFEKKISILKTDGSKFNVLNKNVILLSQFTEKELLDREKRLSDIVSEKYDLGTVNYSGIKFEDTVEIICTEETNEIFNGAVPVSFKLLDVEIPADSFAKIIIGVGRQLLIKQPEKIRELATNGYNPWNSAEDARKCLHYYAEGDKDPIIGENICINTTYASNYSIQFCVMLMKELGIDADQLIIYLKKDSIKKENTISKSQRASMVREALRQLADNGKVVYTPETMPKSDTWIKFQIASLNEIFKFDGSPTIWDDGRYQSVHYLEYNLAKHRIAVTVKTYRETVELKKKLEAVKEKAGLLEVDGSTYWHIQFYNLDFDKIITAADMQGELYSQLADIVDKLEELAARLKDSLS